MSNDGFNADDIASTFVRFSNKRRNIVCDESRLERKKPEPMTLPSATKDCGGAIFMGMGSIIKEITKSKEENSLDEVYEPLEQNGWKSSSQGYGYYRKSLKD
ncbi:hypothetical protein A3780_20505 [Kosakonia radicincitans]|uniref:hypothetical protein n=1 Tax=Kosakonia radicincitans TaxID=283686 RepID=UPI000903971A|nr:hypothetical protein [Kosakonia radicincitans]APG19825.1 hypothetical protein A3780_20505 [Kosakonia radicincitans]